MTAMVILLLTAAPVLASGFQLTAIGGLDTTGYQYSEWWYNGTNPTLRGITTPSASVSVSVNGEAQTVTADETGAWSAATTMETGDHEVVLTSEGSTIAFTLHLGAEMPAGVGTPSASTQPVAGTTTPTLVLLGLGGLALVAGLKLSTRLR